jgi:hypothetical protein
MAGMGIGSLTMGSTEESVYIPLLQNKSGKLKLQVSFVLFVLVLEVKVRGTCQHQETLFFGQLRPILIEFPLVVSIKSYSARMVAPATNLARFVPFAQR